MLNRLLVPTDGSDISIAGALRAVPLAKMAGASITVLFVQDTYSYTGIGETNAAGLHAYMAAARAEGTSAIGRITDAAAAMGGSYRLPRGRGSPGSQGHRGRGTVLRSRSHRDGFARPQRLGQNGAGECGGQGAGHVACAGVYHQVSNDRKPGLGPTTP